MRTKQENRKKRLVKVQILKQELDKQSEQPVQTKLNWNLTNIMRNKLIMQSSLVDDDSELLQRLKEWNSHKKDYELTEIAKKASSAGVVNLDENQIKIMIIKLQQIEKLLKEVGKQRLNNK